MSSNNYPKLPHTLRYRVDDTHAGHFQLVDAKGTVWAGEVPCAAAALVLAAAPGLLRGYEILLGVAHECFRLRWNLGFNDPDFEEFLEDEGDLERRFPGAPAYAKWLRERSDRASALLLPDGSCPVERYVEAQADLFALSED